MRLFLLLAAVLVGTSDSWKFKNTPRTHYQLPNSSLPLKDGSIITIYFFQNSTTYLENDGSTFIFYNKSSVIVDEEKFKTAEIWTSIGNKFEVFSGSQWKGHNEAMYYQQDMSEQPHPHGWWRFDFLKHNSSHATLFIQGCYAGVRRFDPLRRLPLDDIKSIYLMCRTADHSTVQMSVKSPTAQFNPMMTVEKFDSFVNKSDANWAKDKPLISFPNFPVGTHIEMIAVMRARSEHTPALIFKPKTGADFFVKIYQEWVQVHDEYREEYEGTHELHIQSGQDERFPETKPMGELQHLRIARTEPDVVTMTQLYHTGENHKPGYLAEPNDELDLHTISVYVHEKELMDGPFQIMSHNGALILHLEHNIPVKKN